MVEFKDGNRKQEHKKIPDEDYDHIIFYGMMLMLELPQCFAQIIEISNKEVTIHANTLIEQSHNVLCQGPFESLI